MVDSDLIQGQRYDGAMKVGSEDLGVLKEHGEEYRPS